MYDDYYDGNDSEDYEYDPAWHMTNDPVDFAMNGYGGFGYDTSHVQSDEPISELVSCCKQGNLNEVKRVVDSFPEEMKAELINKGHRWTEVDYRMSGFTKEYEWYGPTPLIAASTEGRDDIVEFLLREGADPTLEGCLREDYCANATKCTKDKKCIELLNAAHRFWNRARYSGPQHQDDRRKREGYGNKPTDMDGLVAALDKISPRE
mmetsp:Transcript_7813/g.11472  ORF Transcript_7813/g.11472 Transcript_7813/m.11472 type:complete len:207 (+) Transcript_7813:90-710(+)